MPLEEKTSQGHRPPSPPSDKRNVEPGKEKEEPLEKSVDSKKTEAEQPSKQDRTRIGLAIFAELALRIMKAEPEISWPIDEESRMSKLSSEEALFATLARETFEESVDFEKGPLEDARLVAVAPSDLSDEREVKPESDILLDALTQQICEELIGKKLWEYFRLYVAQNAITCCFAILNSRVDEDNFSDRVKQSLFNAEKIWAILPQKNLSCSLEGIFMIANHLTEEEKKALLGGFELPETFHNELKAFVTGWNILEPLRKKGYSLEEVASALISMPGSWQDGHHNLVRRQAKKSIDLTRQVSALMNQYGYEHRSFRELLSVILAMKEKLGSYFNGMLAGNPEMFCSLVDLSAHMQKTFHFLERKGYTKNEVISAEAWLQKVSVAILQGKSSLPSESLLPPSEEMLEDAIKTAREFSSLFQKHSKPQHSIEELLPAANDVRLEHKQSLEDLLKEDPEVLYAAVEGKIFAAKNPGLLNNMSNIMSGFF